MGDANKWLLANVATEQYRAVLLHSHVFNEGTRQADSTVLDPAVSASDSDSEAPTDNLGVPGI